MALQRRTRRVHLSTIFLYLLASLLAHLIIKSRKYCLLWFSKKNLWCLKLPSTPHSHSNTQNSMAGWQMESPWIWSIRDKGRKVTWQESLTLKEMKMTYPSWAGSPDRFAIVNCSASIKAAFAVTSRPKPKHGFFNDFLIFLYTNQVIKKILTSKKLGVSQNPGSLQG